MERIAQHVRDAQRGDQLALRALFDRFHRSIMSYCLLSTRGDRDLAKDRAQETFSRAFRHLHKLEDAQRFKPWLFSIAANVCRSAGAKETNYQQTLDALALELRADFDPRDQDDRMHNIQSVRRLIEQIEDEELRRIVQLKYTSPGHTTRQIAQQLQIPHGTVTVKLMRFRASYKKKLILELMGPLPRPLSKEREAT